MVGKTKCPVCNTQNITPFTFQCGHIVAEAEGGPTNLENLRPICSLCNISSGRRNMKAFKKAHFTGELDNVKTPEHATNPQSTDVPLY
jgi:hypothetical protein